MLEQENNINGDKSQYTDGENHQKIAKAIVSLNQAIDEKDPNKVGEASLALSRMLPIDKVGILIDRIYSEKRISNCHLNEEDK